MSVPGPAAASYWQSTRWRGLLQLSRWTFARVSCSAWGSRTVLAWGFGPEARRRTRQAVRVGKGGGVCAGPVLLRDTGIGVWAADLATVHGRPFAELAAETGGRCACRGEPCPSQAGGDWSSRGRSLLAVCALVLSDIETYRELREGTALFASPVAMRRRCRAARASRSRRVPSARSSCAARARAPDVTAAAGLRAVV